MLGSADRASGTSYVGCGFCIALPSAPLTVARDRSREAGDRDERVLRGHVIAGLTLDAGTPLVLQAKLVEQEITRAYTFKR